MNPHFISSFNNTQEFFTSHIEIVDMTEMRNFNESAHVHCRNSRELQEGYIEVIIIPPRPIVQMVYKCVEIQ